MHMSSVKYLFLDCDSTLCSIEGIDELAALRDQALLERVAELTNRAMDGELALEEVYGQRLAMIAPSKQEVARIAQQYLATLQPEALAVCQNLRAQGWRLHLLSGGLYEALLPLARALQADALDAVPIFFDENGAYKGFDHGCVLAGSGGKPRVIASYLQQHAEVLSYMVGDGASDMECVGVVDHFVAYSGVVAREKVLRAAERRVASFAELEQLLLQH